MELPILKEVVIILGLSVLIILLFQRFKMPSILGFLITGIVAGPYGLSLIKASHEVEILAETGIIFLLFVIGIEFSLQGLVKIKNTVLIGGSLQVGGTILLTAFGAYWLGLPPEQAIFMGFLISLSSTAIVLKMLGERGQLKTPQGRIAMGILIFQDLIVVPMILITPLLAGNGGDPFPALILMLGKFILVVGLLFILARFVVPKILFYVVKSRSQELFILTTVVLCFATAWLTSSVGLSLALGAFFAGLIISESDYSHQATANILPFREIFISFFFVSVGMLLDLQYFFDNLWLLLLLTTGVILLKMIIIVLTVIIKKYTVRTAFIAAFTLFQVGEFSFLLSTIGIRNDLITHDVYQSFLVISILTMAITPFLIGYSEILSDLMVRAALPERVRARLTKFQKSKKQLPPEIPTNLHDHLVIVGFGLNGQNVARTARQAGIPQVIVELDQEAFGKAKNENHLVVFGDASSQHILAQVNIHDARVVVIAISDAEEAKKIISTVRESTETAHIIVRTRSVKDIEETLRLGADEVIPEEFETSIEIFTRVLTRYLIPFDQIQSFVTNIRAHNYELLLKAGGEKHFHSPLQLQIPDMVIASLEVQQEDNKIVGKTIFESGLKSHYNVTVLAIRRKNRYITYIDPSLTIEPDDMLYLFGSPANISRVNKYLILEH
ncbi:MAG: cation:proton antiporter [Bacteroidales bacterium]|nr:cation:proton antiporter [Bacteroidales bacterium]